MDGDTDGVLGEGSAFELGADDVAWPELPRELGCQLEKNSERNAGHPFVPL